MVGTAEKLMEQAKSKKDRADHQLAAEFAAAAQCRCMAQIARRLPARPSAQPQISRHWSWQRQLQKLMLSVISLGRGSLLQRRTRKLL